jgi:formylglycine-generating enzyme required for sulfatase activity
MVVVLVLLIHSQTVLGQQKSKSLPQPPNCVKLHDTIFIDKTEINNIHWLEYVYYLKRDSSSAAYTAALPDSTVWLAYRDTAKYERYLRHPSFHYFPVVGITHQQAKNYCQWRSRAVTQFYSSEKKKKEIRIEKNQQAIFNFRLPTETEWIAAASGTLDQNYYPYGYIDFMSNSSLTGKPLDLYERTDKTKSFETFAADLKEFNKGKSEPMFNVLKQFDNYFLYGDNAPRISGDKKTTVNTLGIFDMIGNVAEFVEEQGFAKGGGWAHYLNGSAINRRQPYAKPEAWLGFRCVCEVEVKPAE